MATDESEVIEIGGHKFFVKNMLKCAIRNGKRLHPSWPAWKWCAEVLGMGRTSACTLCHGLGFDPETGEHISGV